LSDAPSSLCVFIGNQKIDSNIIEYRDSIHVFSEGLKTELFIPAPSYSAIETVVNDGSVVAPMPSKVSHISVAAGTSVKKGQTLMILEAMKMEHAIKSPKDGVVDKINYKVGDLVGEGKKLLSFK
jgi:3-methylcrotonyl-CoA carboxylase alpha subunit